MNTLLSALLYLALCGASLGLNLRPVIGIAAQENDPDQRPGSYIPSSYVRYLQQAGAEVVPVRINQSPEYYKQLFSYLNGILYPGGGVNIITSKFAKIGQEFFKMAIASNDQGDHFPMWGTCQGFELLTALVSGKNVLKGTDAENYMLPLNISKDALTESRMFSNLPSDVYMALTKNKVTANFHHYALLPKVRENNPLLKKFFRVLSTNHDRNGIEFISTIEGYKYPFYGVQWHPEKNLYDWDLDHRTPHTKEAVRVAQHFANFFVSEARKSSHKFPSPEVESSYLIENFNPTFDGATTFEQNYYFEDDLTLYWSSTP